MAQWLTVWRAAHLVGVPRGVLQQQVRDGAIELRDGLVSTDTLLQLYPQTRLEESGLLERVIQIRDEAFGKRLRERILPSQEVLAQRLFSQTQELADVQRHLQRYHALVLSLRDALAASQAQAQALQGQPDPRLADLRQQLEQGLARVLATEGVDMLDVMDDMLKVVSAQVTLKPSGHQFTVEGHDSLLQASMKAGLKLPYGCGNGSCGLCKVRVTSGDVVPIMHSDYPLSAPEKAQGCVLACTHTAGSAELTLEALETQDPADIPQQQIVATVRAQTRLDEATFLLHLQTPRSHRLRFLAGQWVTLGLPAAGPEGDLHTELHIASCPCDDRNLFFFIANDPADPFASRLFQHPLVVGSPVTIWGPQGRFVLSDETRPLVFACCDTGFAPAKSLIEHALAADAVPSISLYWLAGRPGGHFMTNPCHAWSEALDNFDYSLFTEPDMATGAAQMAQAIRADLFDIDCMYYVSGPAAFVHALCGELSAAGVTASQLRTEVL
jgi:CDP-4-dehydro-6-deoxyglucose reductase